ncbi:MAG: bifunctional 5,10-methylene-tetrahydrofolate dehydrogenase/5,10-methylene-tetrahydrofolate cyclohydrolase [Treponema sp.]|nr:bifunctional 5,10-methylene-tetrahydrofolate dehydrogenase/5,10-methylene-tetrahydrofolate cyclohydrolase [Treponema sp.]
MSAKIIDGKSIAAEVRADVARKTAQLKEQGIVPCLAVILAGDNPASVSYVAGKRKALAEAGMADRSVILPGTVSEAELLGIIDELNNDRSVHGILVQLPLPPHISAQKVTDAILPEKDVDGFHPVNAGRLVSGEKGFLPCTPNGITVLLKKTGIETAGKHVVIVGRSSIVGKPLALLLLRKEFNATVTVCHTGTENLASYTKSADILVVASGHPGTVTASMIKEGACVIDVGVNRIPDPSKKSGFRLAGDVDFEGACEVAGCITPVPGGVGPMTIAMLMHNTLESALSCAGRN